jgi:23S rRNA (guanine745-N1)-methyltransferase
VDEAKEQRLEDALGPWFRAVTSTLVERSMRLARDEVADLVAMGPSAHHVTLAASGLPERVTVTCSVRVSTFAGAA